MGAGSACIETMTSKNRLRQFFFPSITPKFLLRVVGVALSAYLVFTYVLIPIHIQGSSMEPTYHNGGINFAGPWVPFFRNPQDMRWWLSALQGTRSCCSSVSSRWKVNGLNFVTGNSSWTETRLRNPMFDTPVTGPSPSTSGSGFCLRRGRQSEHALRGSLFRAGLHQAYCRSPFMVKTISQGQTRSSIQTPGQDNLSRPTSGQVGHRGRTPHRQGYRFLLLSRNTLSLQSWCSSLACSPSSSFSRVKRGR